MKLLTTFFLSLCFFTTGASFVHAQGVPIGSITGQIIDGSNEQAIEFATVSVLNVADSSLVTGGMTDENGAFKMEKLPLGKYIVQADFIGYHSLFLKPVELTKAQPTFDYGQVGLQGNDAVIETAEVTADRNAMQLGVDRKIFDVEKSNLAKGGTAIDVLRNTPSLNVDLDGNVSLRGSQGVTVLINGKPSSLTGANRKAILNQIPAEMIKSVEIITNPSAKFDPDGMAGIINIVLKKNKLKGFSGNTSLSIGTMANKYNASLGLNYRNEKFNLFSNYNFNYNQRFNDNSNYRENILSTGNTFFNTDEYQINTQNGHFVKLGMDYSINDKNTITVTGSFNPNLWQSDGTIDYTSLDGDESWVSGLQRTTADNYGGYAMEYNLNYVSKFKKEKQELSFDFNYSLANNNGDNLYTQYNLAEDGTVTTEELSRQRITNNDGNQIFVGQVDYTHTFEKIAGKLEMGAKSTIRNINNDLVSENYDYSTQSYINDIGQTNNFIYNEQVYAAYTTYGQKIKKFNFQVGMRLEQALTTSELVTTNEKYTNDYFSFFPSAHLGYELPKMQQLQLSYSRRINRPSVWTLNPFISFSDPYNLYQGNPYLKPEYTHSVEMTYAKYWKGGSLSSSVYYRHTTDVMRRMKYVDDEGVSTVQYTNFDQAVTYGIEAMTSLHLAKWWRLNLSANVYRMQEDASNIGDALSNDAIWGHGRIGTTFSFEKPGLEIELNTFYRSPLKVVIGTISEMVWTSAAISKTFLKKQATLSLRLTDPFNVQRFDYTLADVNYSEDGKRRWESRVAYLSFTYNFGKMDMSTRRRMNSGKRNSNGGGGGGL